MAAAAVLEVGELVLLAVVGDDPLAELADTVEPGRLGRLVQELADRPGPELLPGAAATVDRLRRAWQVTSSG